MSRLSLQIVEQGSGEVLLEAQPNGNFLKFGNEQQITSRALKRAEKTEIRALVQQLKKALSEKQGKVASPDYPSGRIRWVSREEAISRFQIGLSMYDPTAEEIGA